MTEVTQTSNTDTNNGMATAGMVLGIIALSLVWIPFLGLIALPLTMIGTPLSGIGFVRARKLGLGLGVPIAGIATNVAALALFFFVAIVFVTAMAGATAPPA